uniref:CHAD domain-containing protein n=1 Tax=Cupriavidus yeoncheonensis TaxID=1462994 RepID=UPI003F49B222
MTLHKRQRRLHKRGRGMAKLDEQQRHRARIAAKKLRYATEFFESLFPANKVRPYREQLSHLQDDLGWRNDMAVAESLLCRLGAEQQHLAIACAYARGNIARRVSADKGPATSLEAIQDSKPSRVALQCGRSWTVPADGATE